MYRALPRNIYRDAILLALIIIEVSLTLILYYEDIASYDLFHFLETLVNLLFIVLIIKLSRDLTKLEYQSTKEKVIYSSSPSHYILINSVTNTLELNSVTKSLLNITSKKVTTESFKDRIGQSQWEEIKEYIESANAGKEIRGEGVIVLENLGRERKFLQYKAVVVINPWIGFKGVILWLVDITAHKSSEIELLHYLHKYRNMSFELDTMFNSLDFPVWRRNEREEVVFANRQLIKLANALQFDSTYSDIKRFLDSVMNSKEWSGNGTNQIRTVKRFLTIEKGNSSVCFTEVRDEMLKEITGYLYSIDDLEEYRRTNRSLSNVLFKMSELVSQAILVLDSDGNVKLFNQLFVNLFGIESSWLETKPSFNILLDKMRERNVLPEVKDYREFKQEQLKLLREAREPDYKYMHLSDGKTLRVYIIPLQHGETIFGYENITDTLALERSYNELLKVYKGTLDILDEAITIYGQDGRLRTYNNSFCQMWGITEGKLSNCPHFKEILSFKTGLIKEPEQLKELEQKIISSLESREEAKFCLLTGKGGCEVVVKPLPDNTVLIKYSYQKVL